jgi:hypothetical protein
MLCAILLGIANDVHSQKKSPYSDYWEQEAKREQFEQHKEQALRFFRQQKLDSAISRYKQALEVIPGDQEVIARMRDIALLKEKREREAASALAPTTQVPAKEDSNKLPLSTIAEALPHPIPDTAITETKEEVIPPTAPPLAKPVPQNTPAAPKQSIPKEPAPEPERPFKNSDNYKQYLATIYKQGWTEEKHEEGSRKIVKRVFVKGNVGTEYLKVTHAYGAVFYFMNGDSISKSSWISETGKE